MSYFYFMRARKNEIVTVIVVATIYALFAVYMSCSKPGGAPLCRNVVCNNGGYCDKGNCSCAFGYEGLHCDSAFAMKFAGAWDTWQTTIGSDSVREKGTEISYISYLKLTATPTTFFINNFMGNASYNQLVCVIDSANTTHFVLDSTRGHGMIYDNVFVMPDSKGMIYLTDPNKYHLSNIVQLPYLRIQAQFIVRKLTTTHNWRTDTLSLIMTPHH